jgi:hypothetical protein
MMQRPVNSCALALNWVPLQTSQRVANITTNIREILSAVRLDAKRA